MNIESLTCEQVGHLTRWLQRYPGLDGLEALLLARLESAGDVGQVPLDSGRLSRELEVAHALVRRSASSLENRGLIDITARRGAGPGLWLSLIDGCAVAGP
ncbi:hypothetical protein [Kushneria phyllosphaerae]|uniref:HTH marR-type domain-containing protein n=1 Tax=Kushneria phyllosphaerae TaxID=2100822 RepID=A0A2R8CJQ3_9GAMM|nr:hypothetical protein [Kushneria phyllosphaerae]SPJ33120.1 hypothetical protein KSP9073_01123 [Kushneria phyllosphaerae]